MKIDALFHHVMKAAGTSVIHSMFNTPGYNLHADQNHLLPLTIVRKNDFFIAYNDYALIQRIRHATKIDMESSKHVVLVRDPIQRFISLVNHFRVIEMRIKNKHPWAPVIGGGSWERMFLSTHGCDIMSENSDANISKVLDSELIHYFLLFDGKNYAGSIQASVLHDTRNLQCQYVRQENFKEDLAKVCDLEHNRINVTQTDADEYNMKNWTWDNCSSQTKQRLIDLTADEYGMLKNRGVLYNIPNV